MKFRLVIVLVFALCALPLAAAPVKVQIKKTGNDFELFRDGQPYFIKGAGGDASKQFLKDCGGNSFRTWGADDIDDKLAEAQKLGLTVTIGIWLGHEQHHFDYNNEASVAKQFESAKRAVMKYKDHPAVLMWAVGNEMEGYKDGDNPKIWKAVQDIAAMIHKEDPNHPTMTVVAELGGKRIQCINEMCPDIDAVGINTYAGGPSIAQRYRAGGGIKPFVVTEFGPPGTWEIGKNSWGAPTELTSTKKADMYRATYEKSVLAEKGKLSIGSYVFAWGAKIEATATWYGLFLADGTRLEAIDTMHELWSGQKVTNRCPQIEPLKVLTSEQVKAGETIRVALKVSDPEGDPLRVKWVLNKDMAKYDTGGETQPVPPDHSQAIVKGDLEGAELKMPDDGGGYWLFAYVYDNHGGAAMSNVPLFVKGSAESTPKASPTKLPLVVYEDQMKGGLPYVWSGWMGNIPAIAMDEKCADNPHSGDTCMKIEYKAKDGFGGIVWQNPANDWGEKFGGFDLSGAKRLTFWARGEKGDEKVSFRIGIIGKDKKFHDSASAEMANVFLDKQWKQYDIDLSGKDLSCIKTGFSWAVGGSGEPITFYLDDIRYDAEAPNSANKGTPAGGTPAQIPFAVYQDNMESLPFIWSGWMGNHAAIKMDDKCADSPHGGKTCMKLQYTDATGFGGIVWQNPVNDWGSAPGGFNLTGAKKLTFWARGEEGGEKVDFKYGLIGKDKKFFDTASGDIKTELTKDWKQFEISLEGKDLTRIKTGFAWVLGGQGKPVVFYIDDVQYE